MAPRTERRPDRLFRFSRGVELRMLLILCIPVAGFALVREATKPYVRNWWNGEDRATDARIAEIDLQKPATENELAADWKLTPDSLRKLVDPAQVDRGGDAELARRWRKVIGSLEPNDRFGLLQTLLTASGERTVAEGGEANGASDKANAALDSRIQDALRAAWEREHAHLFELAAGSPEEDVSQGSRRLALSIRERVDRQLEALARFGRNAEPDDTHASTDPDATRGDLAFVLRAWDRAALDSVVDSAAIGDSREFDLWYRLCERLSHVSDADLRAAANPTIAEASLARQPEVHRGELVTIKGIARGGKSVVAEENPLGLRRYYVIWVQPDDDRDKVIAVYSLSRPAGFPELPEQAQLVRFSYRVEAPAYFVKKFAYPSEERISVSPVVLARSFRFVPKEPEQARVPPSTTEWIVGLTSAVLVGSAAVAFIHVRTRRRPLDSDVAPDRIDVPAYLRKTLPKT